MSGNCRLVIKKPSEGAARIISDETLKLINNMVVHLVRKFGIGYEQSILKLLEVNILVGRRKNVYGMFKMDTGSTGQLYLYVNQMADSYMSLLKTIAHEMVHARQWAFQELRYGAKQVGNEYHLVHMWDEMAYEESNRAEEHEKYKDLPWERAAFAEQDELVMDFIRSAC